MANNMPKGVHVLPVRMLTWISVDVVTKQKITECKITKTEVRNEIEIFVTITKYNTRQGHEESKHC